MAFYMMPFRLPLSPHLYLLFSLFDVITLQSLPLFDAAIYLRRLPCLSIYAMRADAEPNMPSYDAAAPAWRHSHFVISRQFFQSRTSPGSRISHRHHHQYFIIVKYRRHQPTLRQAP